MICLEKPKSWYQWLRLYLLYRTAFPRAEQKPFWIIVKKKAVFDCWCILQAGKFVGLAITMGADDLVLVDYFAVCRRCRGSGIGSAALKLLRQRYLHKQLFLEIESVYEDSAERPQRLRRKAFYLKNSLTSMGLFVWLFGVPMELLGFDCVIDYNRYRELYRRCAGERFQDQIQPLEYPHLDK